VLYNAKTFAIHGGRVTAESASTPSGGVPTRPEFTEGTRSEPAEIAFRSVVKRYPGRERPAVEGLTFEVPPGEICVLIGPSGCGKTTALKMVNRLISISDGDIAIDGQSVRSLELTQLRRGIGYVFQQIGLFPHMTVEHNIGSVPRLLGWSKARIRARARELLALVGLDPEGDLERYPGDFSGGQQQRIGVARAMAADPQIMLMDEPFGAIDPIARDRLQNDFLRLHRQVRKTVIFVTHDIDEALKMGDKIAIMRDGRLVQLASADELLASPADEFVARFVGEDRGLKRLRVRSVSDLELDPPVSGEAPAAITNDTSLHTALSSMLVEGLTQINVVDEGGRPIGSVRFDAIARLVAPAEPGAGAPAPSAAGSGTP
jgi:osmoprotectant transport system ATP-binding protein